MATTRSNSPELPDPHAQLEREFINEYMREHLPRHGGLRHLSQHAQRQLLAEASCYASSRLAELETRASLVTEVHGVVKPGQLN
jgi:hypothetical protein